VAFILSRVRVFSDWLLKFVICLVIVSWLLVILAGFGLAQYRLGYYPTYSIVGTVSDAPDGKSANGYNAYFYHTIPEYSAGFYSFDTVGPAGASGQANRFMINAFSLGISSLNVGETYYVGIPNDNPDNPSEGYGADPVAVTISGRGVDEVATALTLTKGGGAMLPPPPAPGIPREPAPVIRVWFGRRLYQPAIYGLKEEGKQPFVVPEKGNIKVEVNIPDPFLLNEPASYAMSLRTPLGEVKSFNLSSIAGVKASSSGVKPFVIESPYPEELKAVGDETVYIFTFNAASGGTLGMATSVATTCAVTVMGGPLRLIGVPLNYPSPVHLKTEREAYFQYTLSRDGNIDIFVVDISARVVKRFTFAAGEEGGSAGTNKVKWDLITDQGTLVSSGIYVWSIIDRDSGKMLGKGKFTCLP